MTITEQIAQIAGTLPEALAREALDFVRFLQVRERTEWNDGQNAQTISLAHVWDNAADEVWNDVPLR
ncbi:MAG: hypothetical protein Q8M11_05050 [Sulfuritalea sp.]|nr:hypothetical protein [Sulfuritalea sp.]MDP1983847.1 hypothetical protein [Sulfuritalea sp.]